MEILNIWTNLDKFLKISVNFEGRKLVDHILEIPRLLALDIDIEILKDLLNETVIKPGINKRKDEETLSWDIYKETQVS